VSGDRCLHVRVTGRVQGVCFRHYTQQEAERLGVAGWVRNLPDGSVEALLSGNDKQLAAMRAWLTHGPDAARVDSLEAHEVPCPPDLPEGFVILY